MFRVKLCWWEPDLTDKEIMLGFLNYLPQCLYKYILYMKCIFLTPPLFYLPLFLLSIPFLPRPFHFSFHDVLHSFMYPDKNLGTTSEIKKNQFFWDWLNSLNMIIFSHTHFPANNITFFLFQSEKNPLCIHTTLFIHSSEVGHLGWFHNSAVVSRGAVSMCTQKPLIHWIWVLQENTRDLYSWDKC